MQGKLKKYCWILLSDLQDADQQLFSKKYLLLFLLNLQKATEDQSNNFSNCAQID
jgi:hypothetical protein